MKLSQFTFALAVLFAFVLGQSLAVSDDDPAAAARKQRMERVKRITSPGPVHKQLGARVGTWDVQMRYGQKNGPAIPMVSEIRWVIDGRWLSEEMKATIEVPGLGTWHQFMLHGYDNHTKNYVSCGITSMDTSMNMFRGVQVDPNDKVFTQYGTINEYLDDTFNKPVKVVSRTVDDDTFEVEIWDLQIGETGKPVVWMSYKRKKTE